MKPLKSTEPVTSILNSAFQYVSSSNTDIAKTFARIIKQQADAKKTKTNIRPMARVK